MDSAKVTVKRTKKYGRAVYAKTRIRKGEVIAAFDGPCFDDDFEGWNEDLLNHAIQYGKTRWRDSKGIARLINHSCEPNCGIKSLFKIVAMRAIAPGEEITWDYEMTEKNRHGWRMKCRCGAKSCRRVIGDYAKMPRSVRRRYAGYISEWLLPKKKS
ncbi:MAG TPA: SET domain-containing protein-lysine N-methyltransferase [Bdellovibrionales bacterium]|nr:SET domain-containing protein-lysine N-methyltransferase [Bdellovibrionales bacterium]